MSNIPHGIPVPRLAQPPFRSCNAAQDTQIGTIRAREDKAIYRAIRILEKRLGEEGEALNQPEAVRAYLKMRLAGEEREVFMVLFLNAQNRVISVEPMFYGTLTQVPTYPREVARRALHYNASAVIFAHNHPSGASEPTAGDNTITQAMKQSLALVDVQVLDHFIVAGKTMMSFAERGLI
ncbi:MAG: DNA repair protein RadC [Sulfuricellaceae bacterium]